MAAPTADSVNASVLTLPREPENRPTYEIELLEHGHIEGRFEPNLDREFSLPPVDGGKDAWLCLLGGFFLEVTAWGFVFSFGVLQDYYTTHEPFLHDASSVSFVGSCCMGIMYFASPLSLFIMQRWPRTCRFSSLIGLAIACVGILSSAFATKVWHLILTQGVLFPIGACMLYYPILIFLDEWFVQRKGLAYGVCWAGSGVAGVTYPFLIKLGLSHFSYSTTMKAWAVIMIVLVGPFLPFVKPRIQASGAHGPRPQPMSFKFLLSRSFVVFQGINLLQSLGYYAPSLYLPTYARMIAGESGTGTTIPVIVMNAGMVIGMLLTGILIDRWHVTSVLFLTAICSAFGVFVVWGLSVSITPLCIVAFLYGIFASSSSATWPGIAQSVRKSDETAPTGVIMGILAAGRGIGSIACGPISQALVEGVWPWTGYASAMGYGTKFGALIIFTGITVCFGTLGLGARRLGFVQ